MILGKCKEKKVRVVILKFGKVGLWEEIIDKKLDFKIKNKIFYIVLKNIDWELLGVFEG